MRFFSDGPSIPDLLLERRDQGRVVFLCGAGVSFNAGMPSFLDLTKHVVEFFDPPDESQITASFRPWEKKVDGPKVPLDQIFHLLYQEYGRDDVNTLVAERLRMNGSGENGIQEHKIIARISSDQEGNPQIVTTNFDRLFERAFDGQSPNIYEPPAFPDINLGVSLSGITYLHGRLKGPDAKQHSYVLSSADFGRAYLSEGWATNFIRALLDSYTVVLVGYQAEDPPVKYLLQGLNYDGLSDRSKLYAFEKGQAEEIETKWRDRGVTAIPYDDHSYLWQSLNAWADRARDPRKWRSEVVNLAMKGPRQLAAYERGQVAHLVRSTPGARLFANVDPAPPAEWLCVFDASCRIAQISNSRFSEEAETFDPLEVYGLDDDPPRPPESGRRNHRIHDHIFEWRRGDTNPPISHRLGGRQTAGFEDMPPRLFHLSNWITKHLGSPIASWWALRQNGLHPRLVEGIRRDLGQNKELYPEARRLWNLILEYQADSRNYFRDHGWFHLKDKVKIEGWSLSTLREFEALTAPILTRRLPFGIGASKPPLNCWEETYPSELASWEIKFPDRHGETIDIPNEVLNPVFTIAEGHLSRAARLLKDLKISFFNTPTCYPNREVDGQDPNHETFFELFLELFAQMITHCPANARAHAIIWSAEEEYYFRKLKFFALNQIKLFEADEAAEIILTLNQESFWDTKVRRELLFLISDRWEDFSKANKIALTDRLLNGPDRMSHWSEEEYPDIKVTLACRYTRWLTLQGRDLSTDQTKQLNEKIYRLPEWNDGWASSIVTERYGRAGWVGIDETPDTIIDLPINEVIQRAKIDLQRDFDSFTDKRPFTGLVKANPRKALTSLTLSARKGDYPKEFWSALINEWPEETRPRLFSVFLRRLARLPEVTIRDLQDTLGRWIEKKYLSAFLFDKNLAWKTFDHLVSGLNSQGGAATRSGLGETRVAGVVVQRSRRTYGHAISGPIGKAAEGLLHALNSLKLTQGHGIPEEFKTRLERLLASQGEGGDHTVAILTHQISWLYYLDPVWVMERILPWFNFKHPASEPAWNGYLAAARCPPQEIGTNLKPLLLELFPRIYHWSWEPRLAEIATQIVVELAVIRKDHPDGLSPNEARHCLRNMNDQNRREAVFRLSLIGQREDDGWSLYVIPFINTVWPRERKFRTSTLVSSWVSLLESTGENFPSVLRAVRKFLVPVEGESHWLYRFSRDMGGDPPLTEKYPEAVLELLDAVVPNSAEDGPYELAQMLDLVEQTDPSLVRDRRFLRLINLIEQT